MKNEKPLTNAREYVEVYRGQAPRVSFSFKLRSRLRWLRRRLAPIDDFDWSAYPEHYRAESEFHRRVFTETLREIDYVFENGRLYLLADCKPLNPTHRCLLEAIGNLPDIQSVAEIGVGGGHYLTSLRSLLGPTVELHGYDLSERQLAFFKERFPEVFASARTATLDITQSPILTMPLPDVVYASTVLMHIQRPAAYEKAMKNTLASASKFVVLMDNWTSHDYFGDLNVFMKRDAASRLYVYDSGVNTALIVTLTGHKLGSPYIPLTDRSTLSRYIRH